MSEIIGCFKLDRRCSFVREEVQCLRANLTYIPEIPGNISGLSFSDNYLPHITSDTFMNISNPRKLTYLRLAYDHIKTIRNDSFESFTALNRLSLTGNHIEAKSIRCLLGVLCHLKLKLTLNSMGSSIRLSVTFSLMNNCAMDLLSIERNDLAIISRTFIRHADSVKVLYLDRNRIKQVHLSYMKRLEVLYLSYNELINIPNFCNENDSSVSMVPNIRFLSLRYNRVTEIRPESFKCLTSLEKLEISGNHLSVFPNDMLTYMPFINWLKISPNDGYSAHCEKYAFRSRSLSYLQFGTRGSVHFIFPSINDTFKYSPNLTYLSLFVFGMNELSASSLNGLFAPLQRLKNLTCFACGITLSPSVFIENMTELIKLDLAKNSIQAITDNSISSKRDLKYLIMNRNKIVQLSPTNLPLELLNQLDRIDFSRNPFLCDCQLKWFIEWLTTTDIDKIKHAKQYICAGPERHFGKSLFNVEFTYFECHPWHTLMWVSIIGSSSLLVILISVIVYHNRWNIKHLIHQHRMRRNYIQIEGNDYSYDAFVSYNHKDSDWVRDKLLPILETEYGYKLCIRDRDYVVGVDINDNIVQINKSKVIVLILSESFTKSGWCHFELNVALTKHIEDDFPVIVILLEEIRNMNTSMKTLIAKTTYLEWKNGAEDEDFFKNKLKRAMLDLCKPS
ncbi:hypothetical protein ACF0H5_012427 [Mactra antiquata]